MPTSILSTKLYIPPPRSDLVSRPHLLAQLDKGITRKLTLICAPAGFGKTTILSEWAGASETSLAWLSLDKGDNDLARFLTYIVTALQIIDPEICKSAQAMTQAPQLPPIESVLTELINEVSGMTYDSVLILDDFHMIEDKTINNALTFLIDNLPPKLHLIISGRSDPFLPLARLRAKGQLTELRAENLRFSTEETFTYLNKVMGLPLSNDDISALESRTEGWIAGLHLAALSLQGRENIADFISSVTVDDRYIADYLIDEVLEQRPKGTRNFLLQTSILTRMNGPLCDVITGEEDGQKVLEKLDQANLFIAPLDNQRRWYRYHHLFVELLRHRLEVTMTSREIKSLHQRASHWYEENNFLVEAVDHALNARDYENVIRLITEIGSEMLVGGKQHELLRWEAKIPQNFLASQPKLCMIFTWAWVATGHQEQAERYLQMIEVALGTDMDVLFSFDEDSKSLDPLTRAALLEVAVVRAELAIEKGNIADALRYSNLISSSLQGDEENYLFHSPKDSLMLVNYILGLTHKILGEFRLSDKELTKAAILGEEQDNVHVVAGAYGRLVGVQVALGQLRQAVKTCQEGIRIVKEMGGQNSPISGLLKAELGNLLYETNDLKNAQNHLQEAIVLANPWAYLEAFVPAYIGLARLRAAGGDLDGAFAMLDELSEIGRSNPALVITAVESYRARLQVANGQVDKAIQWAQDNALSTDGEVSISRIDENMVLVRILIAQADLDQAADFLSLLLDVSESAEWIGKVIELLVLQALAQHSAGKIDMATTSLEGALNLSEPEGYVRIFVDEGEAMASLLRQASSRGISRKYVEQLLAAFETNSFEKEIYPDPVLYEHLSERELEVLHYLKSDLSGPEIARELSIALTTIRFHTRNIYGKLNVNNRIAALRKAEELKII